MSVVFRAEDAVLGREVALKVLNDTYAGDALRCERFEREARIMARVSHENLVQLYAVGRDQGLFYIAMELVEGNGLDALIAAEERVPEDRVLRLTLDIVRGLDAAWNAGSCTGISSPPTFFCLPTEPPKSWISACPCFIVNPTWSGKYG